MNKFNIKSTNNFTDSFEKEIFTGSLDVVSDYTEIALDAFIKDDLLNEIPIIKSIISFYKIGSSIADRHNMKKLILFFKQFHSNSIEEKKLEAFKQRLNSDSQYQNKVLELTLVLIERFIDERKSKVLANLLSAHIENNLTWIEYRKLTFALNALNPGAFSFFIKHNLIRTKGYKQIDFKVNIGQMAEYEPMLISCGVGFSHEYRFLLNKAGVKLYDFGFSSLTKEFLEP